jgi:hypothetical protein
MNIRLTGTRLFTFGCSFTQYIWPTWADILGKNFDFFENWALAGAGNLYIFNSIIEANRRRQFNPNDTIVIVWTGLTRIDYYKKNVWMPQGADYAFQGNDGIGYEIINYAYIEAIKNLFDSLKLNYKMFSLNSYPKTDKAYRLYKNTIDNIIAFPYTYTKKSISISSIDLKKTYYYNLMKNTYIRNSGVDWPDFDDFLTNKVKLASIIENEINDCLKEFLNGYKNLQTGVKFLDSHPTPKEHLLALYQMFSEYKTSDKITNWVDDWDGKVNTNSIVPYTTNYPKIRL